MKKQKKVLKNSYILFVVLLLVSLLSFTTLNCGGGTTPLSEKPTGGDAGGGKDTISQADQAPSKPDTAPDTITKDENNGGVGEPTPDLSVEDTKSTPDLSVEDTKSTLDTTPDSKPADMTPDTKPADTAPVPDMPVGKRNIFKVTKLILSQNGNEGEDLTGDKKPNNQLGKALAKLKPTLALFGVDVQKQLNDQIAQEKTIVLFELTNMSDATGQSGTADVSAYLGMKTNTPGVYQIDPRSLNQGKARVLYKKSKITNGVINAGPGSFMLLLSLLPGKGPLPMEFKKAMVRFKIQPGLKTITNGSIGGALPVETLDLIPTIQSFGSVLEVLLQFAKTDAQPDIDLDNDGLETFAKTGSGLTCTDGDGKTQVTAPSPCPKGLTKCNCPQNTKIADGLSAYFKFEASRTRVIP